MQWSLIAHVSSFHKNLIRADVGRVERKCMEIHISGLGLLG